MAAHTYASGFVIILLCYDTIARIAAAREDEIWKIFMYDHDESFMGMVLVLVANNFSQKPTLVGS
jgi:hypothetical protein